MVLILSQIWFKLLQKGSFRILEISWLLISGVFYAFSGYLLYDYLNAIKIEETLNLEGIGSINTNLFNQNAVLAALIISAILGTVVLLLMIVARKFLKITAKIIRETDK